MITLIATAFRANNTLAQNWQANKRLLELADKHKAFNIEEVIGSFKEEGQEHASQEVSYKLTVETLSQARNLAGAIMSTFNQDAVLLLTDKLGVYRVQFDGAYLQHLNLGHWVQITEEEAQASECYTLDSLGQYWAAK